jgi:hypothetical protein
MTVTPDVYARKLLLLSSCGDVIVRWLDLIYATTSSKITSLTHTQAQQKRSGRECKTLNQGTSR